MWMKRPMTSNTLLACTVVNTRWPVSAACTAISAVSGSRISPTMILSGSWRRMERRPRAKVRPFFRSEDQVASQRRLHRNLGGFRVADLAHHDLVRVVAQDGAQAPGEGEALLPI